jgi:phosphatidylserine/phosphatidylglycerophosphate/cardiolipin synthase-like enzyme
VNAPLPDSSLQFLGDGTQQPEQIAELIASFLGGAHHSLDVAIYDCGLAGDLADSVRDALTRARERGVAIRVAYHSDTDRNRGIPPPSSRTQVFVESLGVPCRPVGSQRNLMHHKYVIRDGGTDAAAILTGSTNWGRDAWSREENVILQLFGAALAGHYCTDFEQVWAGDTETSGHGAGGPAELSFAGQPMPASVWFAPSEGPAMAHAAAGLMAHAKARILIASPVLTSGTVLGALGDVLSRRSVPIRGIVDRTQMEEVRQQWSANPQASWKLAAFETLAHEAGLVGKRSTPWSPQAIHDYMHLKMIVVDDTVLTGSFNFSRSGEDNAENLLQLESGALARVCADFIEGLIERYGDTPAVEPA